MYAELADPLAWARKEWGERLLEAEIVGDGSARVVLGVDGRRDEMVVTWSWDGRARVEYVLEPQGRVSFRRSVTYELRPSGDGTSVAVTETVDPTLGFKLLSLGLYVPLASFMARRNLRHDVENVVRRSGRSTT